MNSLRNYVQLIGNLGKDVELVEFESGKKLAKVRMATNDFYKNGKGETEQRTEWHNLVGWGKTAEFMHKVLQKGNEVVVQGKLTHRSYEDKQGNTKYISEVLVNEFIKITKEEMPF